MIAFSCSHCGMKLKVKPEFAGRSSRCPTCKQALIVPAPSQTPAHVAAGGSAATDSSLAKAGIDGGVTLEQGLASARPGSKSIQELSRWAKKGERYVIEREIARGGMGTVLRAVDCDIRREVAVKYLLDQTDPKKKARFVEEAQITGQLEHPNIVPIHELGVDALKRLFFSMKMVKGRSLAQVLDELRQHPNTSEKEYSLGRLLNILVSVCHALAYAHSRGVVHRDLKPANIMLGDFGEVYVMDWGLAKVLGSEGLGPPVATVVTSAAAAPAAVPVGSTSSTPSSKVVTSRQPDADLTADGSVLGTPAYMPPEQALGKLSAIDQRSDVYALGAILYELLTLRAPVDKEGGYLAVLLRVGQGAIAAPEARAPERAKAGKVPRELSAVAMKALAKERGDRYPSVEALRRDVERYQDGRSVSAKADSMRELAWKLVKRNQAVSAATFVFLAVLLVVLGFTLKNYAAYAREQAEKERRTREAVPAFVEAAKLAVDQRNFDTALAQVNVALEYDPDHVDARLLKAQLLILRQDFAGARAELERYLRQKPADRAAAKLLELCQRPRPDDVATLLSIAQVFGQQKAFVLADGLLSKYGKDSLEARTQLLELLRQRIDSAWPGLGKRLQMDKGNSYRLDLSNCLQVTHLGPLHGMPLTALNLYGCSGVQDFSPLEGMPLTELQLTGLLHVRDLSMLKGMPLTTLSLSACGELRDLSPLKGLPLTSLDLSRCSKVKDLSPLQGMPLTWLSLHNCEEVQDVSVLKGLPLTSLNLSSCGGVGDLKMLQGMPLTALNLTGCNRVRDLGPLKGMSLTWLGMGYCKNLEDLGPLHGIPLMELDLNGCAGVRDLSPLEGMKLLLIWLPPEVGKGMDALRRMKSLTKINSMPAGEFWKKYDAGELSK